MLRFVRGVQRWVLVVSELLSRGASGNNYHIAWLGRFPHVFRIMEVFITLDLLLELGMGSTLRSCEALVRAQSWDTSVDFLHSKLEEYGFALVLLGMGTTI